MRNFHFFNYSRHLCLIAAFSIQFAHFQVEALALSDKDAQDLVKLQGDRFEMGCKDCKLEDALPIHMVEVSGFWMDATPVTNAAFAKFVASTQYVSVAERKLNPKDYPGVPVEKLVPGSGIFQSPLRIDSLANALQWWVYKEGASWKRPEGPSSDIKKRLEHPVVHIAYPDAEAYCQWAGKRLPTEAEYEYAARGGLKGKRYAWGDELKHQGKWMANVWQGNFPLHNSEADGYKATSPVRAFPPNGFGIYDVGGNVWQWTSDWYRADTYKLAASRGVSHNPKGPESSEDPNEPSVPKRVQRGGSYLCSDQYCTRYFVGSRGKGAIDSSGSNTGFRCARDL